MGTRLRLILALLFAATCHGQVSSNTPAETASAAQLAGLWQAKRVFGPQIEGTLRITRGAAGWTGEIAGMSVPVRVSHDGITFELPDSAGTFLGVLADGESRIVGHWIQPGTDTGGALRLSRGPAAEGAGQLAGPSLTARDRNDVLSRGKGSRRRLRRRFLAESRTQRGLQPISGGSTRAPRQRGEADRQRRGREAEPSGSGRPLRSRAGSDFNLLPNPRRHIRLPSRRRTGAVGLLPARSPFLEILLFTAATRGGRLAHGFAGGGRDRSRDDHEVHPEIDRHDNGLRQGARDPRRTHCPPRQARPGGVLSRRAP